MKPTDSFAARLREITRAQATETGSPDPSIVAAAVLDQLTPRQCREALSLVLPNWVRIELSRTPTQPRTKLGGIGRGKDARVRDWHRRQLATPLSTGSGWKHFGECTVEDLHAAATSRYEKAAQTHAEGDRLVKIANYMDETDRRTVAQIPPTHLKQLMEAA